MKKIPNLVKDGEILPGYEWVNDSTTLAYRLLDGTPAAIFFHKLYKMFGVQAGKEPPAGAIRMDRPTENNISYYWIPCDFKDPSHSLYWEGLENAVFAPDGTYELIGPKVAGNNEQLKKHILVKHDSVRLNGVDLNNLKEYLQKADMEGIVFHNILTGEMCKARKKDFGFKRRG